MNSVVQISLFIVLSFALHVLSLPFDLILPTGLPESGRVGVSYVSRSLETFRPEVEREKPTDRMVKTTISSMQKNRAAGVLQPKQTQVEKSRVEASKSVVVKAETKQKSMLAESVVVTAVDFISEKPMESLESAKIDAVVIEEVKSQLSAELQVVENDSSLDAAMAKIKNPDINQGRDSSIQEENNNHGQGFRGALARYDVNPPPRYPKVAKLRGWEGEVVFKALILKSGRVGHLNVLVSSGYRSLDNAARKAIARWKFRPATSFGMSLDSHVEIPITFSLKGQ